MRIIVRYFGRGVRTVCASDACLHGIATLLCVDSSVCSDGGLGVVVAVKMGARWRD